MRTNAGNEELMRRMEELVREHLRESRRAIEKAVGRVFGEVLEYPVQPPEPKKKKRKKAKKMLTRRTESEIVALEERFYNALCDAPGESMAVLAGQIGVSRADLQVPVLRLKRAKRIRSSGKRAQTRYYPMLREVRQ
jgi:hypothetical protein